MRLDAARSCRHLAASRSPSAPNRVRLDNDKLETLHRWGKGLRQGSSKECAAAGRAILMLIEEIEQLQIDLSHARQHPSPVAAMSSDQAVADVDEPEEPALTLRDRLQQALRQDSEEAGLPVESDTQTAASPQAWIESLRRRT